MASLAANEDVLSSEAAQAPTAPWPRIARAPDLLRSLDFNLHSPSRQLIDLRIDHADLDATIDRLGASLPEDELVLRRLKKRRLSLRDEIVRLERAARPPEPA